MLTEFTKTKVSFMLALLGMLFALHPVLDPFLGVGYEYLGIHLRVFHAYTLTAGLLSLGVYFYGIALMTQRPHSWLERLGNSAYALAIIVPPLFGGLYFSSLMAHVMDQSHLAWAAPTVALVLGLCWLVLSQLAAMLFRRRLGEQDRQAKIEQLTKLEVALLSRSQELFAGSHFDLSVIEAFKRSTLACGASAHSQHECWRSGVAAGPGSPGHPQGNPGSAWGRAVRRAGAPARVAMSSTPLPRNEAERARQPE